MPPRKKPKSAPPVTDHISALPDNMLHHVLSFLPVQAAVRTCALARRWRHLWRSTTGLRIVRFDDKKHLQHLRNFMHHLLVLRERTDLDTVEIKLGVFVEEDQTHVNLWTRFAVMCRARALTLHVNPPLRLYLDDLPLVSRHLRTLDLHDVDLPKSFIDFAGCPALEGSEDESLQRQRRQDIVVLPEESEHHRLPLRLGSPGDRLCSGPRLADPETSRLVGH
ncbi:hypothetical protein CFC21_082070 [Triticum aestivum]|uniref:F-box domain-containing protein n=2 Tax=Triticum aestivum TaxID=4565 RepID=A0A9R1L4L9_WHEAT|nr:hypothetical protein CFC21_082070 [Triticum aestivum]